MEKRSESRRNIKTGIICRRYSSGTTTEPMEGTVKNCGPEGFCAEIGIPLSKGTILVVQMAGDSTGDGWQGGFRSMGLAEVRWSKPIVEGSRRYTIGLKYLMAY